MSSSEMDFVSFHSHTTYSYGDGFGTVKEHVMRVAELGMTALGISEHGHVNSHAALEREAHAANIKPIFGVEAYFGPVGEEKTRRKTHLGLYAMNLRGYHNLNRIVAQSYEDFYQWPTVSWENLEENNEGIAVLSGCSDSYVSCKLLGGKFLSEVREDYTSEQYLDTRRTVEKFAEVFENRYFLEVQRFPHLPRTCVLNPAFARISRETGIPLFATADVHYPRRENNAIQAALHSARWASTSADFVNGESWELSANLSYPESDEEIHRDLVMTGLSEDEASAAIKATSSLAQAVIPFELPKAGPLVYPQRQEDWQPW